MTEKLITKSFERLLDKGKHRGFITYEELGKSLGKRGGTAENIELVGASVSRRSWWKRHCDRMVLRLLMMISLVLWMLLCYWSVFRTLGRQSLLHDSRVRKNLHLHIKIGKVGSLSPTSYNLFANALLFQSIFVLKIIIVKSLAYVKGFQFFPVH